MCKNIYGGTHGKFNNTSVYFSTTREVILLYFSIIHQLCKKNVIKKVKSLPLLLNLFIRKSTLMFVEFSASRLHVVFEDLMLLHLSQLITWLSIFIIWVHQLVNYQVTKLTVYFVKTLFLMIWYFCSLLLFISYDANKSVRKRWSLYHCY